MENKEVAVGDVIRTFVYRGKDGLPIGKLGDGKILLFANVPEDLRIGTIAVCEIRKLDINYVIGTIREILEVQKAPIVEPPRQVQEPIKYSSIATPEEGFTTVEVRLSNSASGFGFHLPIAINPSMRPYHKKKFQVKFRCIE